MSLSDPRDKGAFLEDQAVTVSSCATCALFPTAPSREQCFWQLLCVTGRIKAQIGICKRWSLLGQDANPCGAEHALLWLLCNSDSQRCVAFVKTCKNKSRGHILNKKPAQCFKQHGDFDSSILSHGGRNHGSTHDAFWPVSKGCTGRWVWDESRWCWFWRPGKNLLGQYAWEKWIVDKAQ